MLDDFMVRALLAGLGLALVSAPLGCFVVWRRMAYFGDATAHAAMLGVALSLAIEADVFFWCINFCYNNGLVDNSIIRPKLCNGYLVRCFFSLFFSCGARNCIIYKWRPN